MEKDITLRIAKLVDLYDNVNTPDLDQTPDSILRPGETLEDFDVRFRRPNADGGMLVKPSADGSRPGYANPEFGTKEFIEKRDKGKAIPKVREYLNKILRRKDSITFDTIADIKEKAGLGKDSKVDADISRLLKNEYKDTVKTKGQLAKVGNAEKFRKILRDIQKTIPKGQKQFINIAFTAKKNNLPGDPNSGAYSRILQEPEFNNFVVLTKDKKSNPQIIRFAQEFEKLYEDGDLGKFTEEELAKNIYGDTKPKSIMKVRADASKYAEFLYGVREVTDANGNKLKLPSVEKRGDLLFELLDELEGLEEGEKGKVRQIRYNSGVIRDRMFAIRDGLLGLKEGQTDAQRRSIIGLLKKGYNLDEVAGLAATHELAPGYTELVQGLKKKVNRDKMLKIDKPFSRIFEQVITDQKPTKGYQYGFDKSGKPKFYQNIEEVVKLYNKDAAAYGKKYGIDVPLIEYSPGKKINPKNFLPNYKYLSPEAQANIQELAKKGVGVRTEALTMSQVLDAGNPNLKTDKFILNKIQSYSKLPECKINLKTEKAEGGRIGFANSITCIQDGLREQKIAAQRGNKKAAEELIQVGKVATRAGLLKNLLGPGAILGEAVYEGAIIGNKILGGKPADIAWAESYLSYLDPRKYRGELDPLKLEREDMLESTADKNILQTGFDAQDRISAFNEAREKETLAEIRQRPDQLMTEAEREKIRAYEKQSSPFIKDSQLQKDVDIISSEAFKDATNVAQEYLQGKAGEQMADFGVYSVPQSAQADEGRRVRAMTEMKSLYPQYSDKDILNILKEYNIDSKDYDYIYTPKYFPKDTSSKPLTGFDDIRDFYQREQSMQNIADAGGIANLAGGGIAGLSGGIDKGPQTTSMNPDSQGLQGLMKRGMKG